MNNVIKTYNQIASKYLKCREELVLKEELDNFLSYIRPGGFILDAGCGNGRDLKIFSNKGFQADGIDGSIEQIKIARQRIFKTPVNIIHDDLRDFNIINQYDGIWCNAVLPHFCNTDIIKILDKFRKALKKDGIIFASFKQGMGERLVVESEFDNYVRYTNFHQENDIKNFAESTKLDILEIQYYNERMRFNNYNRDLNFIVVFFQKK